MLLYTLECTVLTAQYKHMTCILKSQTWLSLSLAVLHVGDTARLSDCCFSAIRSGTRNQWIQCSSHDRLQILCLQGLARQAFIALLWVLLFWALVYYEEDLNCQSLHQYSPAWKIQYMLFICHPIYRNIVLIIEGMNCILALHCWSVRVRMEKKWVSLTFSIPEWIVTSSPGRTWPHELSPYHSGPPPFAACHPLSVSPVFCLSTVVTCHKKVEKPPQKQQKNE